LPSIRESGKERHDRIVTMVYARSGELPLNTVEIEMTVFGWRCPPPIGGENRFCRKFLVIWDLVLPTSILQTGDNRGQRSALVFT